MARPAALRLGAGQGRLCRRHEAPRLGRRHRLVPRRELLRLPRHERLGRRRAASSPTSCSSRKPRCSPIPTARRPIRTSRARGCAAGPSISPAIPTASRRPISTISPANSRASTIAAPVLRAATAGTPAPIPICRCSARCRASCMSTARASRLGQYLLPAGDTISEPVFVARGDDAAEGDGWLLAAVWRAAREPQRSRGLQRHRRRSRPRRAGAARAPGARRLSRQLGRGGVSRVEATRTNPTVIPGRAAWRGPGYDNAIDSSSR